MIFPVVQQLTVSKCNSAVASLYGVGEAYGTFNAFAWVPASGMSRLANVDARD